MVSIYKNKLISVILKDQNPGLPLLPRFCCPGWIKTTAAVFNDDLAAGICFFRQD